MHTLRQQWQTVNNQPTDHQNELSAELFAIVTVGARLLASHSVVHLTKTSKIFHFRNLLLREKEFWTAREAASVCS